MVFIMQSGVSPSSLVKQAQLWPSPQTAYCRDGAFVKTAMRVSKSQKKKKKIKEAIKG